MNGINMNQNMTQGSAPARSPMNGGGGGLLGGMDIGTVSALIVLASAFMRR